MLKLYKKLIYLFSALVLLSSTSLAQQASVKSSMDCNTPTSQVFQVKQHTVGQINLTFAEGPDNGPPLVLIPGMGGTWQTYLKAARHLCTHFHIFMIDQRGHGESSEAPDGSYRVSDYGQDLKGLINQRIKEPVFVSGHSLGGLVALWLAAYQPELVLGLNAEDPPYLISELPYWDSFWLKSFFAGWENRLREYHANDNSVDLAVKHFSKESIFFPRHDMSYERRIMALGKLLSLLQGHGMPPISNDEQARVYAGYENYLSGKPTLNGDFWPAPFLKKAAQASLHLDPEAVAHAVSGRLNDGFDHLTAFKRVKVPTLYWESDREIVDVMPSEFIQSFASILQNRVRFKHFYAVNLGHRIHSDDPELFAEEIIHFFLRHDEN